MIARAVTAVVVVALALAAPAAADVTADSSGATTTATVRLVVRPVTGTGHAAAGFRVTRQSKRDEVDCRYRDPSPGAVSRDVEVCSPSAAYAVACWKAAEAGRVLCSRDASSRRIYSIPRSGAFAKTRLAKPRNRAPLLLILRDGTTCSIRVGGAWSSLKSHPNWYGTYTCDHHGAVWSPPNAPHDGVDESKPVWTVRTARFSGDGHVTVRAVRTAYFVGTAG
jgi:hypothetical protein